MGSRLPVCVDGRTARVTLLPTRLQWVGLARVMRSNEEGRRTRVAGGKRVSSAMERKDWIRWFHDPRPDARARLSGWDITDAGREAYWAGQRKYGPLPADLLENDLASNACRGCGDEISEGRRVCSSLECGGGELPR